MPWKLHGRRSRISRQRRSLCPSVSTVKTWCRCPVGTASTVQVSFRGTPFFVSAFSQVFRVEEKFICADCEYECLAFNEVHTKKHTLVRVIQKIKESKISTEERIKAVEGQLGSVRDELSKMRQLLSELFEKGAEGSQSDPLMKGDILFAGGSDCGTESDRASF